VIRAKARRQHGLITRAQLLALGLSAKAIMHRLGRNLFPVHRGVYAVGRPVETPLQRAAAARLACGPGAALSHEWALWLWGFVAAVPRGPCHVTARGDQRPPGVVTHHPRRALTRNDIRTHRGIRVTSPARTLLDCAPRLPAKRLYRIAADARRSGHLHMNSLIQTLMRFPHQKGRARLLGLVDGLQNPTRSDLEDVFLDFCRRYELPTPLVNSRVAGHEVDMLFPESKLIVELDGWEFHRDRHVFESDRDREVDTAVAGFLTVHITWARLMRAPAREAARLAKLVVSRHWAQGKDRPDAQY
jgi:hypothetical protein